MSNTEVNVIRIEVASDDPDAFVMELALRAAYRALARAPRWRFVRRRELLAQIGVLEERLRNIAAERDARALDRTRRIVEGDIAAIVGTKP